MGGKKKYMKMFGSFTEPFSCNHTMKVTWRQEGHPACKKTWVLVVGGDD